MSIIKATSFEGSGCILLVQNHGSITLFIIFFFCGLYCIQLLILFINQVHINTTLTLFHSYFNLILSMGGQLKSILNLLSI